MTTDEQLAETLDGTGVTANTWQSAARRLAEENRRLRAQAVSHGVAWEDRLNIVCLCGKVCSAIVKRSPARLLGATSDDYVASPAAQAFANHLWEMNHPSSDNPTPPGATNGE